MQSLFWAGLLVFGCPGAKPGEGDATVDGDASFGTLRFSDRFLQAELPDPLYPRGGGAYAVPAAPDGRLGAPGYRMGGPAGVKFVEGGPAGFPLSDGFLTAHPRPGVLLERQAADGTALWSMSSAGPERVVFGSPGEGAGWFTVTSTEAMPEVFGGERTPEPGYETVLVRVRYEDGAVERVVDVGGTGVYGPVVAAEDGGAAYVSQIGGIRTIDGRTYGRDGVAQALVERFDGQGQPMWRRVLGPDARIDQFEVHVAAQGEVLVAGRVTGDLDLGEGLLSSPEPRGMIAAFDGEDGTLLWSRQDLQGSAASLAARADGWVAWVRNLTAPSDVGGEVGTLSGLATGAALATVLLDRCGTARAARVWTYCDCFPDQASGAATPYAAAWSPEGSLWISAESYGAFRFEGVVDGTLGTTAGDVLGGDPGEAAWVVEVEGPVAAPGDCVVSPPPEPVVSVSVQGEGTVTVLHEDGDVVAVCRADCEVVAPRHEALVLSAAPGEGMFLASWDGACTGAGACTLLHDEDSAVVATFAETTLETRVAMTGAVSGARLAVGPDGGMWAFVASTNGLTAAGRLILPTGAAGTALLSLDAQGGLRASTVWPWSVPVAVIPEVSGGARAVAVVDGALRVAQFDASLSVLDEDVTLGVNQDVRWVEDEGGQRFWVENTAVQRARVMREAPQGFTQVAEFSASSVLVMDAVGLASGVGITVNHGANAVLGGVTRVAAGTAWVVLDGQGGVTSVVSLPFGSPTGLLKPSEGRPWGDDLALVGLGDRFGGSGYHVEPFGVDGNFLGGGWGLSMVEERPWFQAFDAIRPLATAVGVAGFDETLVGQNKAAVATFAAGVQIGREVAQGGADDVWYASASDGQTTFLGLVDFGAGTTFGGVPIEGPTLLRLNPSLSPP
ncbi:MAG: hypothetical protein RLZZ383_55 [Pseudomonadota bacterium]|jgi:hypothetical protein